jgi:glycosyltransferase involved in cell wall biosynthesis
MLVSVCTPTFNRRPFIPYMFKCFKHQDYKGPIEWIIIDDGTDKIEDLILSSGIPNIKYYKIDQKISLGKKRNLMHSYAKGDIIIYMDDDDYYPPERISHAVEQLQNNPTILCAGSTILYTYFKDIDKIVQFGPYAPNHATAATFAFRKELLTITSYEENAAMSEEKHFLKNYTIPILQLDPKKVILVISHSQNTFDKRTLLTGQNQPTVTYTSLSVRNFIQDTELYQFYIHDIHTNLPLYIPGNPSMKPDVLAHIEQKKQERNFSIKFGDKILQGNEIVQHLNQQQHYIKLLTEKIKKLELELNSLNRSHD